MKRSPRHCVVLLTLESKVSLAKCTKGEIYSNPDLITTAINLIRMVKSSDGSF